MAYSCFVCKETANNHCGKCKLVCYCSKTCQEKHWYKHKLECVPPPSREELEQCREFTYPTDTKDSSIDIKSLLGLSICNERTFCKAIEGINYCILTNNQNDALELITKCETFGFEIHRDTRSRFHLAKGLVLIMINDYLNAMDELQDAVMINPKNASAYINLSMFYFGTSNTKAGLILRKKGEKIRSMQSLPYTECICGCPSFATCSRCKLSSYCGRECQIKDWIFHKQNCVHTLSEDEIKPDTKFTLLISPDNKDINQSLYNKMLKKYSSFTINSNETLRTGIVVIKTALRNRNPKFALEILDKCRNMYNILSYKELSFICSLKVNALIQSCNFSKAEKILRRAIQLDKHNDNLYSTLSLYYYAVGKIKEAEIIKHIPNTYISICICGKPGTFTCVRCKKINYCCKTCQKTNWKTHKIICVKI